MLENIARQQYEAMGGDSQNLFQEGSTLLQQPAMPLPDVNQNLENRVNVLPPAQPPETYTNLPAYAVTVTPADYANLERSTTYANKGAQKEKDPLSQAQLLNIVQNSKDSDQVRKWYNQAMTSEHGKQTVDLLKKQGLPSPKANKYAWLDLPKGMYGVNIERSDGYTVIGLNKNYKDKFSQDEALREHVLVHEGRHKYVKDEAHNTLLDAQTAQKTLQTKNMPGKVYEKAKVHLANGYKRLTQQLMPQGMPGMAAAYMAPAYR